MLSKRGSKLLILTLSFVLVFSLLTTAKELTILHTNDIHGTYLAEEGVGGFKALSHYVDQAKSESDGPVFLFDAGDVMTGTPLTQIDFHGAKGGAMFVLMNFVGYDAWTYGNHAFDLGQEKVLCCGVDHEVFPDHPGFDIRAGKVRHHVFEFPDMAVQKA